MMKTIPVRIKLASKQALVNNQVYEELHEALEEELGDGFDLVREPAPAGTMGDDLVVAIQALIVTVNALALIWAIIVTRYRCTVTVEIAFKDGSKMTIEKKALSEARLAKEVKKFEEEIKHRIVDKEIQEIIYYPKNIDR